MEITYKITEESKKNIGKFLWIKSHFFLGEVGSSDKREITRLLENAHYPDIMKTLKQIDKYGSQSREIGETILDCKDRMGLSQLLAELSLFSHLYEKLGTEVTPIKRIQKRNKNSPDISVRVNDYNALIEIYSPIDYHGYQTFLSLLLSCIKNMAINIGFNISIESAAENRWYTYDFPQFRNVHTWLDQFSENFLKWLKTAKAGDSYDTNSPAGSVKLKIQLTSIEKNPENRSIFWSEATKSTDTRLFFEIDEPADFAESQWGIKIKDKLQKGQAGEPCDKAIRILAINFGLADTSDLSFLNESKYHANLDRYIKFLVSDIKPYPPYDVVLPCDLGFECGFAKPINLSSINKTFIDEFLATINLNKSIKTA
jgi:hypothetical protein